MQRSLRRGFALRELVGIVFCLVVILAILLPVLARKTGSAYASRDASQMRGIHQSWLVFARDFDGVLVVPGLIDRLPVNGVKSPGRGEEDIAQNTTANLFSMGIMQNYFSPELCVSPREPSTHVAVWDEYDWSGYSPVSGVYWDSSFRADLTDVSHVSYAHMPLFGKRRELYWCDRMNATVPIIGNRGPLNGVHDPKSITNRIHPPHDTWNGNVCFADNHVDLLSTFTPAGLTFKRSDEDVPDNIFAIEDGPAGADAILSFTKKMTPEGPELQHD